MVTPDILSQLLSFHRQFMFATTMAPIEKPEDIFEFLGRTYKKLLFSKDLELILSISEPSIKFLYTVLKRDGEIPLPPPPLMKTAANSIQFRQEGNEHYSAYRNSEAFKCFTQAIAYAPPRSEQLALAYGNRSAALFDLGHSKACIKDIDRALAIGCNETRKKKLLERRKKCMKLKISANSNPNADNFKEHVFKMLPKTRSDIPCANEKVALAYDAVKGRKIIANKDIKPGEILAIEEPYVKLLDPKDYTVRCYHCLEKSYNSIPCDNCSYVMFCNEQCKDDALNHYHQYECPIMYYMTGMGLSPHHLTGFRITLKVIQESGSWIEFRKTLKKLDAESNPMKKGFIDGIYNSKSYAAIHTLEKNLKKRTHFDTYRFMSTGVVLASLLKKYSTFLDESSDEDTWLTGCLIAFNTMTSTANSFRITESNPNQALKPTYKFGFGLYGFMSLFNHSCVPNSESICLNNKAMMICVRAINKGEEITISYGPSYEEHDIIHRQEICREVFKFICDCEGCVNNWSPNSTSTLDEKLFKQLASLPEESEINQHTFMETLNGIYHNMAVLNDHKFTSMYETQIDYLVSYWQIVGNVF